MNTTMSQVEMKQIVGGRRITKSPGKPRFSGLAQKMTEEIFGNYHLTDLFGAYHVFVFRGVRGPVSPLSA